MSRSLANGLSIRPVEETAADALEWERECGLERERLAGITPEEEAALVAEWNNTLDVT